MTGWAGDLASPASVLSMLQGPLSLPQDKTAHLGNF